MANVTKDPQGLWHATIDGVEYDFEKWGAEEALDTLFEIASILGKPLSSVMFAAVSDESETLSQALKSLNQQSVEGMMAHLVDQLQHNRPAVMRVIKQLAANPKMLRNGQLINFDRAYSDSLPVAFEVSAACLEVQYGNFSGKLATLVGGKSKLKPA